MEELPPDFWDTPTQQTSAPARPRTPPSHPGPEPAHGAEGVGTESGSADRAGAKGAQTARAEPDRPDPNGPEPTELEQAFEQLQSLFPGRVVEVRPQATDDGALDEPPAAPHDEEVPEGGYDDDDQDRLSFGPGGA